MKLKDVSRYFDRTPVYDPDTGVYLFNCQVNNYDGSHRDAHAAYRRILSVAPGTVMPPSGAVHVFGETWIVATPIYDGWSELHRQRHVMQRAAGTVEIFTLPDFLTGGTPTVAWGDVQWVVGTKEKDFSSGSPQVYDVYFPHDHNLVPHKLIRAAGRIYLGQFQYDSAAGFTVYRTMRQENAAVNPVDVVTRKYNPASGKAEEVSQRDVPCLVIRWQEFFEYTDQLATKFEPGDKVFLLPMDTEVASTTRIKAMGRDWSVQSIQTADGVKVVHGRPS